MDFKDWRNIENGMTIPTENYCDQPYLIKTDDGAWLCALTTGEGLEGEPGQHIVAMRSFDKGLSWTDIVDIEPSDGPEASYSVLLKTPSGRIYCFYNYNKDNIRKVIADKDAYPDGYATRVDSLGIFVFKYSDDNGKTWSDKRWEIPVRETEIDRNNPYKGDVRFFWNVGKAFANDDKAYVPLIKVGGLGKGFFTSNEGFLLRSDNLLHVNDPEKIEWKTLPEGEHGLKTPEGGGPIAAEQSYSVLSDGSFYSVYRSVDGHPVCSYSRDGGNTWSEPEYKKYADGRLMKHPRAANFAWKLQNGKYLYWFHNHGGTWYEDRNPAWVSVGSEKDSGKGKIIEWSQPEILLFDDNPNIRMSYPDLLEDDEIYVSETQKTTARIHKIDTDFLDKIFDNSKISIEKDCVLDFKKDSNQEEEIDFPELPRFSSLLADRNAIQDHRNGFSIIAKIQCPEKESILLDTRKKNGQGLCLKMGDDKRAEIILNDGRTECRWKSDPEMMRDGETHHIGIVVDAGPKIISFIIDGKFNDGGEFRQFGWGRFSPHLIHANGEKKVFVSESVSTLKLYERALMTCEIIGDYNIGAC
jgi:hypothetical protein